MASYVSLAFGRYVVEPFFAPCAAPTVLIKLVSILGVSEWYYTSSFYPQYHYLYIHVGQNIDPQTLLLPVLYLVCVCVFSICRCSQLLECDPGLSHSGHLDFH